MSFKGERIGNITITEKGCVNEFDWRISDFFSLSDENGVCYSSPTFSLGGCKWNFWIYPNGNRSWNSYGFIHLNFLKLSPSPYWYTLDFSVSLRHVNGHKEFENKYLGFFEGSGHLFSPTISRAELLRRRREFLPSDVLTVVFTLNWDLFAPSAGVTPTAECCHCKKTFDTDDLLSHQRTCPHRSVICPECLETFPLQKFSNEDHACRKANARGNSSRAECCLCKEHYDNESIASHLKSCVQRTIQCPRCFENVLLRQWLDGHECPKESTEGCDCTSSHPVPLHVDKMVQDFKELFLKREDCDATLNVQGREFPVHKAILSARSSVLASAFRLDMKEKAANAIDIEDCDPTSFSDFLSFLYYGNVESITTANVFSLFTTADKYDVQDLRSHCLAFMKENLSVDTFVDTVTVALQHVEKDLTALAIDFFAKNQLDIIVTVKWQSFVVANPIQGNEILIKALTSSRK